MHPCATPGPVSIRPSHSDDLPVITAIYAHAVHTSSATFEIDPPDLQEMTRRRDDVLSKGLPWLVAETEGQLVGYSYAAPFRPRPAYRFALEDSIYLQPQARGRGIGHLLLAELLARCQAQGARQMLAVIGDSANSASINVHRALGFRDVGVLRSAGRKFERWVDVVLMQRPLGAGDGSAPGG